jgi:hypothetical protein
MSETVLEVLELSERAADEVVGAAPSTREMLRELRERPILVEVEPAGLVLVVGEQGTVDVEEALLRRTRPERFWIGSICQGQDLDMLHDRLELTVGCERPATGAGGASPPASSRRLVRDRSTQRPAG